MNWALVDATKLRKLAVVAVMLATCMSLSFNSGAQQPSGEQKRIVVVTGRGMTPAEARNDAVRQALQQTVQQLVFADRSVENQKLVRDRIMSTMNGYVDGIRVISKAHNAADGMFTVEEEITVSLTRIENFLGIRLGSSIELKGDLLFTDSTREIQQRDARGVIFDRLLTGLPGSVIEVQFGSPMPDQRDPTQFIFPVTTKLSEKWLNRLRMGLKAISIDLAQGHWRDKGYAPYDADRAAASNLKGPVGSSKFCIINRGSAECCLLPPGHYGRTSMIGRQESELNFETPNLLVAMRFVGRDGTSTVAGRNPCVVKRIDGLSGRILERSWGSGPLNRSYYLFAAPSAGTITIKAGEVDLQSTERFAWVPLFGARRFGTYTSMHSGNLQRVDDPSMLFVPDMAGGPLTRPAACGELLDDALLARQRN